MLAWHWVHVAASKRKRWRAIQATHYPHCQTYPRQKHTKLQDLRWEEECKSKSSNITSNISEPFLTWPILVTTMYLGHHYQRTRYPSDPRFQSSAAWDANKTTVAIACTCTCPHEKIQVNKQIYQSNPSIPTSKELLLPCSQEHGCSLAA